MGHTGSKNTSGLFCDPKRMPSHFNTAFVTSPFICLPLTCHGEETFQYEEAL